jgi:hypothetical protein
MASKHRICAKFSAKEQLRRVERKARGESKAHFDRLSCMPSQHYECIDLEELRAKVREMTNRELRAFGEAARSKCRDKSPDQIFVTQLEEATAEWRRRHPPKKKYMSSKEPA